MNIVHHSRILMSTALIALRVVDFFVAALVLTVGPVFKFARRAGLGRLPISRQAMNIVGFLPLRRHYYEPAFHPLDLPGDLGADRSLPGLDLREDAQIELIRAFAIDVPKPEFPEYSNGSMSYFYNNPNYHWGDAAAWWSVIHHFKPGRIIEIGSGNSTLVARQAIKNANLKCEHICIEPYEQPWLEKTSAKIIREKVENVDLELFLTLEENDVLFIDSSHVIRPGGDVLHEYLWILPQLKKGVIVHIHDIFTPRHYLKEWVIDDALMWNEQYILEAFLTMNPGYEILLGVNYMFQHHYVELKKAFPQVPPSDEPGSFYIRRM